MANKIDKKATIGCILQVVFTPIFVVVLGTLFSLITGYKANEFLIIVRVIVWMVNLVISWLLSTCLFKTLLHRKIHFLSYKLIFFAYVLSVLLIWSIGIEENDYSYVTSAITIIALVGVIRGIKLYKRSKGRPLKQQ